MRNSLYTNAMGFRGVDAECFSPRHHSTEWRRLLSGGHPEAPILLYVGYLRRAARVAWLRPMMDVLPDVHLVIVGDGPLRAELEELFAGTSTLFTGHLEGKGLTRVYASADIFVSPATRGAAGDVVLQAMASGLPVIAPRAGVPMMHVVDGENGFLFEPDRPEEMVALVCWLASSLAHVRRLGASARKYAETQSWDEVLDDLLLDYTALVDGWSDTKALDLGIRSLDSRQPHPVA
jgi:glycosyltransferase involved in cell wall biosynthesis